MADPIPQIINNPDGTQTLELDGHGLDLPQGNQWRLELSFGEFFVVADGKTPKSVKGLMRLKRVRQFLDLQ